MKMQKPRGSKVQKYWRADSGCDRADCLIFCETARRENKNCHASSYPKDCHLFVFKRLVTAATEEERDGRHQESAMATTGEWRNGLELIFIRLDSAISFQQSDLYLHLGYTNWELQ